MLMLTSCHPFGVNLDDRYFQNKRGMLTARWTAPFGKEDVESSHAPKGPFLGNGDVGLVSYTSEKGQTLQLSKVDFITDDWTDWTGTGPAALPVGGVSIQIHAETDDDFYTRCGCWRPNFI